MAERLFDFEPVQIASKAIKVGRPIEQIWLTEFRYSDVSRNSNMV